MKRKNVVSGAMIVAAGVAASADRVSATQASTDEVKPRITADGVRFDAVRIDDDVLRLGGLADIGDRAGSPADRDARGRLNEKILLAQTIYAGGGGVRDTIYAGGARGKDDLMRGKLSRVPGATPRVVIDPRTNRSTTILFNKNSRTYYDAKTGKSMRPPGWMRSQVEK